MKNLLTLELKDAFTSEPSVIIVRANEHVVSLCVSLMNDGDVEVALTKEDAIKLAKGLLGEEDAV